MTKKKSLLQQLVDSGYPKEKIYNSGFDLYVFKTPLTTKILFKWLKENNFKQDVGFAYNISIDHNTGKEMYEIPSQYYDNGNKFPAEHTQVVEIAKPEYSRINCLLGLRSLSELTDIQLYNLGANTNQNEEIFCVDFDDGSSVTYTLRSGHNNYFDDIVWTSADGTMEYNPECTFELDDIEFTAPNGDKYLVFIDVI